MSPIFATARAKSAILMTLAAGCGLISACATNRREPVAEHNVVIYGNRPHVYTIRVTAPADAVYNPMTRNWERPYPNGPDAERSPGRFDRW